MNIKTITPNKNFVLLCLCMAFSVSLSAQKPKTYLINEHGEKSSKFYAKFKRSVQKQGDIWVARDYYLNDSLRMTGSFLDKKLTQKTNTFTHYYLNGKIANSREYKNNLLHGKVTSHFITGSLSRSANYAMGDAIGKWIWYSEDGNIEYELDNVSPNILKENNSSASYIGGQQKLYEYLYKADYRLPNGTNPIYDKTFTTFQINEEGKVSNVDIIVHGTEKMDAAIIKYLLKMPNWEPAKKNGKYVTSTNILPIRVSRQGQKELSDKILAEAFFKSGGDDYNAENYEKANWKFKRAIERNNMVAKYYYLLGHSLYKQNKKEFACEDWSIANSLDNEILSKEIKDLCNLE